MSKLDKRAISILVIALFLMSMIPFMPAQAVLQTPTFDGISSGQKGDTITVIGTGVTSGATVEIYWDTAIGDDAYLLNSTKGKASGDWSVNFDVPEAVNGEHFVWAKDVSGPYYESSGIFTVNALVELSPSSGLKGDDVDVKGYGFGDENIVSIQLDPFPVTGEAVGTGTGTQAVFYLDHIPVAAGTQIIYVAGLEVFESVAYTFAPLTGEITFLAPLPVGAITADYTTQDAFIIESSDTFKTDELGSFTKTFVVPDFPYYDYYQITALDTVDFHTDSVDFKIGASISITPDEGPTGIVVRVEGRGWTSNAIMSFKLGTKTAVVVGDNPITVVGGKFSADVVIPGVASEAEYDLVASESGGLLTDATVVFDVTGIPEIVVSPTYGSPGATITVTGSNFTQIAGTEVDIVLWNKPTAPEGEKWISDLVTAETDSDGTFEDTFMSPAVKFIGYDVRAYDLEYYGIDYYTDDTFKVGLIAMIINPTHGSSGTEVALTGIGFYSDEASPYTGDFNMTFGEKLYEYEGGVLSEAISKSFYVPNVELGTYDVTVIDEDENQLTVQFTVTAVTVIDLDPAMAPIDYNVTIKGYNFAHYVDTVDFVLYNATDEWEMDVTYNKASVETDTDGNFTGHWKILAELELSLGDYTINITGYDDFLLQVPFSVVEARVSVAPRKALFDRGDTIQFNVKNDFKFVDSYMQILDPYDNLYWQTEVFVDWVKVGDLHTVPYYLQTSGKNPMTLSQDAPLGPWFYIFYEEGTTQLTNGTFVVGPSAAAMVEEKLTEIWASMEGITEDIDSITSEIEDEIAALSGDIDDVVADVQDMVDDITADLAEELAGVAADTEAAVDELEGAIGDIASAQNELASDLEESLQTSVDAKEAAEAAKDSASGLTTLVYGAIAASLIAALAAVVSLMQISKKIA